MPKEKDAEAPEKIQAIAGNPIETIWSKTKAKAIKAVKAHVEKYKLGMSDEEKARAVAFLKGFTEGLTPKLKVLAQAKTRDDQRKAAKKALPVVKSYHRSSKENLQGIRDASLYTVGVLAKLEAEVARLAK